MTSEFMINQFIQSELVKRGLPAVTAVEAARWLDRAQLLNDSVIRPGLPLRNLLRANRIEGQRQQPNGRWFIDRIEAMSTVPRSPASHRSAKFGHGQQPRTLSNAKATKAAMPTTAGELKRFSDARAKHRPSNLRCVVVAEAPPKPETGRFFYFEDVAEGDSLFWEMMKTLYPKEFPQQRLPRHRKREFLERFEVDGFYLIDAVEEPLGKASSTVKRNRIRESLPRLKHDIRALCDTDTSIILVSAPVYSVCAEPLRKDGFNVINTQMIDFPGSGSQKKFREKFGRILSKLPCR